MKTLILNGSPRVNGDTKSLINLFMNDIDGEYMMIDAYREDISPCIDCRYCWEKNGCAVNDRMNEIGMQTYFCARFFRKEGRVCSYKTLDICIK